LFDALRFKAACGLDGMIRDVRWWWRWNGWPFLKSCARTLLVWGLRAITLLAFVGLLGGGAYAISCVNDIHMWIFWSIIRVAEFILMGFGALCTLIVICMQFTEAKRDAPTPKPATTNRLRLDFDRFDPSNN